MGKNRIWKNMMTAGAVFLGILGTLLGLGTLSSFVRVVKAESADVFINQSANWTEQENFKASLTVTAGNLQSLEPEEEKYYLDIGIFSGGFCLFFSGRMAEKRNTGDFKRWKIGYHHQAGK